MPIRADIFTFMQGEEVIVVATTTTVVERFAAFRMPVAVVAQVLLRARTRIQNQLTPITPSRVRWCGVGWWRGGVACVRGSGIVCSVWGSGIVCSVSSIICSVRSSGVIGCVRSGSIVCSVRGSGIVCSIRSGSVLGRVYI